MTAQVKTSHLLTMLTNRATKLLKLYPYGVKVVQELKPSDCPKRVGFVYSFSQIIMPVTKLVSTVFSSMMEPGSHLMDM